MSEATDRSKIESLRRAVADLGTKGADCQGREAKARTRAAEVRRRIAQTRLDSSKRSYQSQAERYENEANNEATKAAKFREGQARKQDELHKAQQSLERELARQAQHAERKERSSAQREVTERNRARATAEHERRRRDREVAQLQANLSDLTSEQAQLRQALHRVLPEKITVLLVLADPSGELALSEEQRSIHQAIRLAEYRDYVQVEVRSAARAADLTQAILDVKPTIVHFSGHGCPGGLLVFQADDGGEREVRPVDLAGMVNAIGEKVRLMIFNACFSEEAARQVADTGSVEAAIGMDVEVSDAPALAFAAGF